MSCRKLDRPFSLATPSSVTAVSIKSNHCSLLRPVSAGSPASVIRVSGEIERGQFRKLADLLEARVANGGSPQEQADQPPERTDVLDSGVGHRRRIDNGQAKSGG